MKFNRCYLNTISVCEVSSVQSLIEAAYKYKQVLLPVNERIVLDSYRQNTKIFEESIPYPQDQAAVLVLKKEGCRNSIVIDSYVLWWQIMETYSATSRFYLIGDNKEVLQSVVAIVREKFKTIDCKFVVVGNHLPTSYRTIVAQLREYNPDFVFIASSQRDTKLLHLSLLRLKTKHHAVYIAVENSFEKLIHGYTMHQEKIGYAPFNKCHNSIDDNLNLKTPFLSIKTIFLMLWKQIKLFRFKLLLRLNLI